MLDARIRLKFTEPLLPTDMLPIVLAKFDSILFSAEAILLVNCSIICNMLLRSDFRLSVTRYLLSSIPFFQALALRTGIVRYISLRANLIAARSRMI